MNRHIILITLLSLSLLSCQSQEKTPVDIQAGGPCQGCEAVYEYGSRKLSSIDTLDGFGQNNPSLKIQGTIFQKDGKTPTKHVILYIYHTDRKGLYQPDDKAQGWGQTHGKHRGWIQTDQDGSYTFYTFRPAPYPNGQEAEHIHMIVKEPGIREYYIDNILFTDDPLLTAEKKVKLPNRAGSGITTPQNEGQIMTVTRDIILGLNIPGYP